MLPPVASHAASTRANSTRAASTRAPPTKKGSSDGSDLASWLHSIGVDGESIGDVVQTFERPEYGVKTLKMLFALDDEDLDDILKGMPLGQRRLIKRSIEKEK